MTTRRLPIALENVRIATPCHADWDDMAGDDRVRFCGRCEKNVYNLSAMTRQEAEALVAARQGRMCVRLYQRSDGTVLTSDCPVGVARQRLRQRVWARLSGAAASAMLLVGLAGSRARADLAVDGNKAQKPHVRVAMGEPVAVAPPPQPLMGKIAMPQPPKANKVVDKTPAPPRPEPMMGDIAVVDPAPATTRAKTK